MAPSPALRIQLVLLTIEYKVRAYNLPSPNHGRCPNVPVTSRSGIQYIQTQGTNAEQQFETLLCVAKNPEWDKVGPP